MLSTAATPRSSGLADIRSGFAGASGATQLPSTIRRTNPPSATDDAGTTHRPSTGTAASSRNSGQSAAAVHTDTFIGRLVMNAVVAPRQRRSSADSATADSSFSVALASSLKSDRDVTDPQEQHTWRLWEALLVDTRDARIHANQSSDLPDTIEKVPSRRRWFVPHATMVQWALLRRPLLRRLNIITRWLEESWADSRAGEISKAMPATANVAAATKEELYKQVVRLLRKGDVVHAAEVSRLSGDAIMTAVLNGVRVAPDKGTSFPRTYEWQAPLFGEFSSSDPKDETRDITTDERRLPFLASLFTVAQQSLTSSRLTDLLDGAVCGLFSGHEAAARRALFVCRQDGSEDAPSSQPGGDVPLTTSWQDSLWLSLRCSLVRVFNAIVLLGQGHVGSRSAAAGKKEGPDFEAYADWCLRASDSGTGGVSFQQTSPMDAIISAAERLCVAAATEIVERALTQMKLYYAARDSSDHEPRHTLAIQITQLETIGYFLSPPPGVASDSVGRVIGRDRMSVAGGRLAASSAAMIVLARRDGLISCSDAQADLNDLVRLALVTFAAQCLEACSSRDGLLHLVTSAANLFTLIAPSRECHTFASLIWMARKAAKRLRLTAHDVEAADQCVLQLVATIGGSAAVDDVLVSLQRATDKKTKPEEPSKYAMLTHDLAAEGIAWLALTTSNERHDGILLKAVASMRALWQPYSPEMVGGKEPLTCANAPATASSAALPCWLAIDDIVHSLDSHILRTDAVAASTSPSAISARFWVDVCHARQLHQQLVGRLIPKRLSASQGTHRGGASSNAGGRAALFDGQREEEKTRASLLSVAAVIAALATTEPPDVVAAVIGWCAEATTLALPALIHVHAAASASTAVVVDTDFSEAGAPFGAGTEAHRCMCDCFALLKRLSDTGALDRMHPAVAVRLLSQLRALRIAFGMARLSALVDRPAQ